MPRMSMFRGADILVVLRLLLIFLFFRYFIYVYRFISLCSQTTSRLTHFFSFQRMLFTTEYFTDANPKNQQRSSNETLLVFIIA